MNSIILAVAMLAGHPQATSDVLTSSDRESAKAAIAGIVEAKTTSVKTMDAERGVAEFMAVCVRPMWSAAKTMDAIGQSDLGYIGSFSNGSGRWTSKRALLALDLRPDKGRTGEGLPQCMLSHGSTQPRTSRQLIAMIKPAIDAELGLDLPILEDDSHDSYVEWPSDDSSLKYRITVEPTEGPQPGRSIIYLFETWCLHGLAFRAEMLRQLHEAQK